MMECRLSVIGLLLCLGAVNAVIPSHELLAQEGLTLTPFGLWPEEVHAVRMAEPCCCLILRSVLQCVHGVEHNSHVVNHPRHLEVQEGERTRIIKRCDPAYVQRRRQEARLAYMNEGDGWQQYVHQDLGKQDGNVTSFLGYWNVPADPSEEAQTLFTFTGLQVRRAAFS